MTNGNMVVLTATAIAIGLASLPSARAADLSPGPEGVPGGSGYRYSERIARYTDREVRWDRRGYRSHAIPPSDRSHVHFGYRHPAQVVVHRTIERRPVVIEHRTVVERPRIVERRVVVERPIIERHVLVDEPAPFPPVVDSGPVVVETGPAPIGPRFVIDDDF